MSLKFEFWLNSHQIGNPWVYFSTGSSGASAGGQTAGSGDSQDNAVASTLTACDVEGGGEPKEKRKKVEESDDSDKSFASQQSSLYDISDFVRDSSDTKVKLMLEKIVKYETKFKPDDSVNTVDCTLDGLCETMKNISFMLAGCQNGRLSFVH